MTVVTSRCTFPEAFPLIQAFFSGIGFIFAKKGFYLEICSCSHISSHDRLIFIMTFSQCNENEIKIFCRNFASYLLIPMCPLSLDLSFLSQVYSPADWGTGSFEERNINSGLISQMECKSEGFHLRRCIQRRQIRCKLWIENVVSE